MPRLCTVCTHPQRQAIDAALLEHAVGYRRIAARFGLADTSVRRHMDSHLREQLQEANMLDAEALAAKMAALDGHVQRVLDKSAATNDDRMALMAVAQGRNNVETLMRLRVFHALAYGLNGESDARREPRAKRVRRWRARPTRWACAGSNRRKARHYEAGPMYLKPCRICI